MLPVIIFNFFFSHRSASRRIRTFCCRRTLTLVRTTCLMLVTYRASVSHLLVSRLRPFWRFDPIYSYSPFLWSPYFFADELSIPLAEQMSIGLPPPNFVRFPFAATPWSAAGIPIVFTTNEPTNTTSHSFVSRSSSPSLSSSPTRSSSPSAKVVRPLSAPFARSPQMGGPVPQPASLPMPPTAADPFAEMVAKEVPTVAAVLPNFASEQVRIKPLHPLGAI